MAEAIGAAAPSYQDRQARLDRLLSTFHAPQTKNAFVIDEAYPENNIERDLKLDYLLTRCWLKGQDGEGSCFIYDPCEH